MENITTATMNFSALMTVPEVARYLRVDPTTVRRWVKEGVLEAFKLPGGDYRIKETTLEKMLGN